MHSARGSAPDFGGLFVSVENGVYHYTFSDSFENEGTATITKDGDGIRLSIVVTQHPMGRGAEYYGEWKLEPYVEDSKPDGAQAKE